MCVQMQCVQSSEGSIVLYPMKLELQVVMSHSMDARNHIFVFQKTSAVNYWAFSAAPLIHY